MAALALIIGLPALVLGAAASLEVAQPEHSNTRGALRLLVVAVAGLIASVRLLDSSLPPVRTCLSPPLASVARAISSVTPSSLNLHHIEPHTQTLSHASIQPREWSR